MSSMCTSRLSAGRPAILRHKSGDRSRWIYSDHGAVQTVTVEADDRGRFSVTRKSPNLLSGAGYRSTTSARWILNGPKDGDDETLCCSARPETVKSRAKANVMERYILKETGTVICEGAVSDRKIGSGVVRTVNNISEMTASQGDVLVTDTTDP